MTTYELMMKTNELLIKGRVYTEHEKRSISDSLLQGISDRSLIEHFFRNTNRSATTNIEERSKYPYFYIPPYNNGKKLRTITMVTPHTILLSSNAYELEIIRILALFDEHHEQEIVQRMIENTQQRLMTACFGNFCHQGECFETSMIVLRFLGSVFPNETTRMQNIIDGIYTHFEDKKRHSGTTFYYRLVLSELPLTIALPEIKRMKDKLLQQLHKSYVANSENDKYVNILDKYILRNCLSRLPEFAYIKDRVPYISSKDGRIHFDLT